MELLKLQNHLKPHKFDNFICKNYDSALNQSIESLLESLKNPSSLTPTVFTSNFLELIQVKPNPPLETIWVFSSLSFHCNDSLKEEPLDQLLVVKELFQSITTYSASCSSSKSVVLIAPVIFQIYKVIVDLKGKDLSKKLRKEIKMLIDNVVGYLNLCLSSEGVNDGEDVCLIRPLSELVLIWLKDDVDRNEGGGGKELLKMFFPLLSDSVIEEISSGNCDVNELAGFVIAEAFLLKCCFSFIEGRPRVELQKELRTWVVSSISGFQNVHFFAALMKMLLDRDFPVISLLNPEDETFLRKVLYDALILVDYSFLHPEKVVHLPAELLKNILITRLIVTHEAIELFRGNGEHTKSISYINAFSSSHLPSQVITCVATEIGMEGEGKGLQGSSPKALLKWLLNLEDQGVRLFDNVISKHRARLQIDNIKADSGKVDGEKSEEDLLFFIDNEGKLDDDIVEDDKKESEAVNASFASADRAMQSVEDGKVRKRKQSKGSGKKNKIKFQRYKLSDQSGQKSSAKDGVSSESDVENPLDDDDE